MPIVQSGRISRRELLAVLPFGIGVCAGPGNKLLMARPTRSYAANPGIGICHIGYRPDAKKIMVLPVSSAGSQQQCNLMSGGTTVRSALVQSSNYGFGPAVVWDFSDFNTPGTYQCQAGGSSSFSFSIGANAWRNVMPVVTGYHLSQRCGTAVAGVHGACHLDDAKRRDTGVSIDTTGGWHDAGDTRKWVDATLMNLFGLMGIARNLGNQWSSSGLKPLLSEARWGNNYFLKMQDTDGLVFQDTAGGVNGDNSDNHWTDNIRGTADDRYVDVEKPSNTQAMFIAAQAIVSQVFGPYDATYASQCLNAGVRCWNAAAHDGTNTTDLAWWILAAVEMYRATGQTQYSDEIIRIANSVASSQVTSFVQSQQMVRGFFPQWPGNDTPLTDAVHSAIPAYALLQAAEALPSAPDAATWQSAVRMYLDEYVTPLTGCSAYRVLPYGIFIGAPAGDVYRPLAGNLTYRFFMPTASIYLGLNSHLLSHALLLAEAWKFFGTQSYRDLAYAQIEWVFGNNPFAATMATGLGYQNPPAFSPFVGAIKGGIMNGICGDSNDNPMLATQNSRYWPTNEYWSPHVGYWEWAQSVLEKP
jgi:hypothetical protein